MKSNKNGPDVFSGDEEEDNSGGRAANTRQSSSMKPRARLGSPLQQRPWRDGQWPARLCSMLCCLFIFSFIAVLASFLYIILKDLRAERITTEDGAEVRLLGFWSMLVLSSVAGVLCCSFSWTLTYFDSFEPGMFPPTPLSPAKLRYF
uniref:ADP-ribosylation factor-like 6 interacting protein 6 n=1 Tax=Astyanax mexicanus TaxID=7994 RepID=A0A8B9K8R4_ASTMX